MTRRGRAAWLDVWASEAADRNAAYDVCRAHGCTRLQAETMTQIYAGLSVRQIARHRGVTATAIARIRDRAVARINRGVRPGRRDMRYFKTEHGPDGLTPLQREVVRLRAKGHTYRWIAVNLRGRHSLTHQAVWQIHQRAVRR
jgi:DNA-binding CsgD family transcriptional regulator